MPFIFGDFFLFTSFTPKDYVVPTKNTHITKFFSIVLNE